MDIPSGFTEYCKYMYGKSATIEMGSDPIQSATLLLEIVLSPFEKPATDPNYIDKVLPMVDFLSAMPPTEVAKPSNVALATNELATVRHDHGANPDSANDTPNQDEDIIYLPDEPIVE